MEIAERESNFDLDADNGICVGIMQIHPRLATMRSLKPIEKIIVSDYDLIPAEQIMAGMLKLYFIKEPKKPKQALEHIVQNCIFILN